MFNCSYDLEITVKFRKRLSDSDFNKVLDFMKLCRKEDKTVPGDKVDLFKNAFTGDEATKVKYFMDADDFSVENQDFFFYINYIIEDPDDEDGYLILGDPNDMQQDIIDSIKAFICATPDLEIPLKPADVEVIWESSSIEKQDEHNQENYWDYLNDLDERAYDDYIERQVDAAWEARFESFKVNSVVNKILEGVSVREALYTNEYAYKMLKEIRALDLSKLAKEPDEE